MSASARVFGFVSFSFFFFKQKTAYEMRISDWSSDVCSSDLFGLLRPGNDGAGAQRKGMNIQEQLAVFFDAAVGNVGVAKDGSAAGVFQGVFPDTAQNGPPAGEIGFVVFHANQLYLTKVNGINACINVFSGKTIDPHLRSE